MITTNACIPMGFLGMEKCAILKVAVFDEKRLDLVAG